MQYSLIYSERKTLTIQIKNGKVTVRAPYGVSREVVEKFVNKHSNWIVKNLEKSKNTEEKFDALSDLEIEKLKKDAKVYLKERTEYFAMIMGLNYGRITITSAKTRFGSCSSKGNICYSYRLMLYPEAAREYVVVHELSHLVLMNHSKKFYSLIEKILPDYKKRRALLK